MPNGIISKSEPNTTWKIVPTKSGQFQWVFTSADPSSGPERSPKTLALEEDEKIGSRLPSMEDLLLQVEQSAYLSHKTSFLDQRFAIPPKPGGVRADNGGGAMFSTGSGRTLSVRQSSIEKARSLFEEEDPADKGSHGSECFPMFRTGLGKSVQVRQSSIKKAAALLEVTNDKEENLNCKDAIRDSRTDCPPLKFHTAGGRSISISSDALKRARNLLNEPKLEALEGEAKPNEFTYSTSENEKIYNESSSNFKKVSLESLLEGSFMNKPLFEISSSVKHFCSPLMAPSTSTALSNQVEFNHDHHSSDNGSSSKSPNEDLSIAQRKVPCYRMIRGSGSGRGALMDISNYTGSSLRNRSLINVEKKRLGKEFSSSSFKRPRTSSSSSLAATGEEFPHVSLLECQERR